VILGLLFVASYLLLTPILGNDIAVVLATLFIFWSVPVEGHIIARAIERDWYLGIAIAMLVFIAQYAFQSALTGRL
jgi:multisubunit Na+/H+ antiporter MnhG subunit